MIFSSPIFILLFLPISLVIYFVIPKSLKNFYLVLVSLAFYGFSEGRFIFFILFWAFINYISGVIIERQKSRKTAGYWLVISVIINLGILFHYKYSDFFFTNLAFIFSFNTIINHNLPIHLAISFFTFNAISYNFDIYRRVNSAEKNLLKFILYLLLFPHLIAGPIIRYHLIKNQLNTFSRRITTDSFAQGISRFTAGLGKKVLIADTLALTVNEIFVINPSNLSTTEAWLGIIAFGLQIYFDFSGYTDMAIGLAKIFGFQFPENFNYPYATKSIGEFWQRWHITLSSWFRDYLYIPLGGNRKGLFVTILNLWVVFLLTGIWHGASWNFVIWGGIYAFFISIEKILKNLQIKNSLSLNIFSHLYSLLIIFIAWVFFRSQDLSYAIFYLKKMFNLTNPDIIYHSLGFYLRNDTIIAIITGIFLSLGLHLKIQRIASEYPIKLISNKLSLSIFYSVNIVLTTIILFLSITVIASQTFQPFIYFRF